MNSTFAGLHILWGSFQHERFGVQGQIHKRRGQPWAGACDTLAVTTLPGPTGAPTAGWPRCLCRAAAWL